MKRTIVIFSLLAFTLGSCSVNSSSNVDIDGADLVYFKDDRTNLCFAATASRKFMSASTTGLGVTCVPCDSVKHLLK